MGASRRIWQDAHGFTLPELLGAAFMSTVIVASGWSLLMTGERVWLRSDAAMQATDTARLGLDQFCRDLRQAPAASLNLTQAFGVAEDVMLQPPGGAAEGAVLGALAFTTRAPDGTLQNAQYQMIAQGQGRMRLVRLLHGITQILARDLTGFKYRCPPSGCQAISGVRSRLVEVTLTVAGAVTFSSQAAVMNE